MFPPGGMNQSGGEGSFPSGLWREKMAREKISLQFRNARPGDRDAIRKLTLSAYEEYAPLMPSHWEDYRENILATLAHVEPAEQIVAERGGAIVGTVLLYPAGTVFSGHDNVSITLASPEVRLLAVAPAARGQGIGTALMRECIRRARRSGAAVLTLHTTDLMHVAMGMYERMGFKRVPEIDFYVDQDLTVKGYRLNLADLPEGP